MDQKQLPAMWKLFLSIMGIGAVMGAVTPFVAFAFANPWNGNTSLFFVVSVVLGLVYAFAMYIFVKAMLRAFVRRLHTLERVVAGTEPGELPSVFVSNEIDEVEKSAARIIARLDAARAEAEA